ncbi:trxA [Symbiodinium microadriaticum]|nr:trxA [Symbiodinium microadriaticum]
MNFDLEVIEESFNKPVLVDFWADWCGPCKFLGPILDELASDSNLWTLVKVDVDANNEISLRFGIKGIPDVRLFHKGEVIGKFTGAKPRHEVEQWLNDVFPDPRLEILNDLIDQQDQNLLQTFVAENSDFVPGQLALAKSILWDNPARSLELMKSVSTDPRNQELKHAIETIAAFLNMKIEDDSQVGEILKNAQKDLNQESLGNGMEKVIESIVLDKSFENEIARKLAISIFSLLGPNHEVNKKYRRKFDMSLY